MKNLNRYLVSYLVASKRRTMGLYHSEPWQWCDMVFYRDYDQSSRNGISLGLLAAAKSESTRAVHSFFGLSRFKTLL